MLLTFSIAALLVAAPQGQVVVVGALEAQNATAEQVAAVRDAVVSELKAQGYEAVTALPKKLQRGGATIAGSVLVLGGTFAVSLTIRELGGNLLLAAATVRCGSAEQLGEAAKEATSRLVQDSREKWGVRTRFKAPPK